MQASSRIQGSLKLVVYAALCYGCLQCIAEQCGRQARGVNCPNNLCCSQWGWCGTTSDYCGARCQSGPCAAAAGHTAPHTPSSTTQLSSIITSNVFDRFLSQRSSSACPSHGFYSYTAFVSAAAAFSGFGTSGSSDVRKRELAAFFANVAHETGSGCYVNEINQDTYCDASSTPCAWGQKYYGRGPLQISWNYNYKAAGDAIGFDGINNPGIVASDATISFKTAIWYWMTQQPLTCHTAIVNGRGFGATINAINGGECSPNASLDEQNERQDRISLYQAFCSILGVQSGTNLSC